MVDGALHQADTDAADSAITTLIAIPTGRISIIFL